jgi:hypothetical protein
MPVPDIDSQRQAAAGPGTGPRRDDDRDEDRGDTDRREGPPRVGPPRNRIGAGRRSSDAVLSLRTAIASHVARGVGAIADDLDRLQRMLDLLVAAPTGFQHAAALDMVAAQAWRTAWLAKATAFVAAGRNRDGRRRTMSATVHQAIEGFAPESRLSGLRFDVRETGAPLIVEDELVSIAVTGAILVTVAFVEALEAPVIEIDIEPLEGHGVRVQVAQHATVVPRQAVQLFSTAGFSAPGAVLERLAALAMAHATAAHGGSSELTVGDDRGSSIALTFRRD